MDPSCWDLDLRPGLSLSLLSLSVSLTWSSPARPALICCAMTNQSPQTPEFFCSAESIASGHLGLFFCGRADVQNSSRRRLCEQITSPEGQQAAAMIQYHPEIIANEGQCCSYLSLSSSRSFGFVSFKKKSTFRFPLFYRLLMPLDPEWSALSDRWHPSGAPMRHILINNLFAHLYSVCDEGALASVWRGHGPSFHRNTCSLIVRSTTVG